MKHLKLLLTLFMGALCSADMMADVVTWTSGDITATFDGSTLTISGQGAIPDFSEEFDFSLWRDGYYRGDINKIVIEDGVTHIGNYAFADCYYFSSITIPSSVTSIGEYAFYQCETLTSIEFPEGGTSSLTSIGESAFYNCEALASVTIPEGVTSIERHTFDGCKNLASISIPETVTYISESAFSNCKNLASISIPETVTSIGEYAFYDCEALASVTIPEGVTSIERNTFCGCKNLASISIPETVTSIGEYAFYDCEALASVTIPEGVTYIERYTFDGCKNLASITIPETVTYIGEYAFFDCEALASVTIPEGVTSIRDYAFCLSDMRLFPVIYCWADPEKLLLGEGAVNCHDFYVNAKYQVKYMDIANAYQNLRPLSVIGFLNEEEDYSELLDNSLLDDINELEYVALGRTFISGYYYTFSFPFDMTIYDLNRGFGESNCVVKNLPLLK